MQRKARPHIFRDVDSEASLNAAMRFEGKQSPAEKYDPPCYGIIVFICDGCTKRQEEQISRNINRMIEEELIDVSHCLLHVTVVCELDDPAHSIHLNVQDRPIEELIEKELRDARQGSFTR